MSKYYFCRMGPNSFESMAQSLLEKVYRKDSGLIQFGDGKDGGREAVFDYTGSVKDQDSEVAGKCVVQVKYHDIGARGWKVAREVLLAELEGELNKVVKEYKLKFGKYILITNVPFTGVLNVGTKDKCEEIIAKWRDRIPSIEIWDAADVSRMLDADSDTRTAYLDTILPGDVLMAICENLVNSRDTIKSTLEGYLHSILRTQREAKADEAGDENGSIPIENVFVDVSLSLEVSPDESLFLTEDETLTLHNSSTHIRRAENNVRSSHAFLFETHNHILIKGGPGVGKSTITQYLDLLHASRILKNELFGKLLKKLKFSAETDLSSIESQIELRFPLRIELRRYSDWIAKQSADERQLASYLVQRINNAASGTLSMDDLFSFASSNPILLMLDGLDEVPNVLLRQKIFTELHVFLDRCKGNDVDINIILSTRPQGYQGDFENFKPIVWTINDLGKEEFNQYTNDWLTCRVKNQDEREDALARIEDGMRSPAVSQMAKSLLQVTVMLNIVRRKQVIPEARHMLFERYVQVIFDREKIKSPMISTYENALLKLHEMVGYKLIDRAQYLDQPSNVAGVEFGELLDEVMREYGRSTGATYGTNIEDRDAILELSRNRVCLLAGKGENQENIDFVIQSFREYFAAAYMYKNEQKCSEKTFIELVKRSRTWANVFRFYVAFEDASTQKSWIMDAKGKDHEQPTHDSIAMAVRLRHELASVLPEITELKNHTEIILLEYLLDQRYMWSWSDHALFELGRNLRAFGSGDHFEFLEKILLPLSYSDELSREKTLKLFVNYSSSSDMHRLQKILHDSMSSNLMPKEVFPALARADCISNVPSNYQYFLKECSHIYYYDIGVVNKTSRLTDADMLVIIVSQDGYGLNKEIVREKLTDFVEATYSPHVDYEIRVFPLLLTGKAQVKVESIRYLESINTPLADYLAALLYAKKHDRDAILYQNAVKLGNSAEVSEIIKSTKYTVLSQLGPLKRDGDSGKEKRKEYKLNKPAKRILFNCLEDIKRDQIAGDFFGFVKSEKWEIFDEFYSSDTLNNSIRPLQKLLNNKGLQNTMVFEIHAANLHSEGVSKYLSVLERIFRDESVIFEGSSINQKILRDLFSTDALLNHMMRASILEVECILGWFKQSESLDWLNSGILTILMITDIDTEKMFEFYKRTKPEYRLPLGYIFEGTSFLSEDTSIIRLRNRLRSAIVSKDLALLRFILDFYPYNDSYSISDAEIMNIITEALSMLRDTFDSNSLDAIKVFDLIVKVSAHVGKVDLSFILGDSQFELYKDRHSSITLVVNALSSVANSGTNDFASVNSLELDRVLPRRGLYPLVMQEEFLLTASKLAETKIAPLAERNWQNWG